MVIIDEWCAPISPVARCRSAYVFGLDFWVDQILKVFASAFEPTSVVKKRR
ncbi:hypothetical protein FHS27_002912 [Rhodopirellula rubra]|uniref:Uncharacterized protein n=1 Tax=Aporhodopirellula rubra TaxID=980271 RepID=A0A7W5DYZ7_9BACT|nr:hypothetical protein [Aporhodopirellula rubra]